MPFQRKIRDFTHPGFGLKINDVNGEINPMELVATLSDAIENVNADLIRNTADVKALTPSIDLMTVTFTDGVAEPVLPTGIHHNIPEDYYRVTDNYEANTYDLIVPIAFIPVDNTDDYNYFFTTKTTESEEIGEPNEGFIYINGEKGDTKKSGNVTGFYCYFKRSIPKPEETNE